MPKQKKNIPHLDDQSLLNPVPLVAVRKHQKKTVHYPAKEESINPLDGVLLETSASTSIPHSARAEAPASAPLHLIYENPTAGIFGRVQTPLPRQLPHGGRAQAPRRHRYPFPIVAVRKHHAGKMVKVDKGDWDKSRGWEWGEFNT